jgi:type VI secretion system FHA domain protein
MPGAGFRQAGPPPGFNAADFLADLNQPAQPDPFAVPAVGAAEPTAFAPAQPAQPAGPATLPVMPAQPVVVEPSPAQASVFAPQPAAPAEHAAMAFAPLPASAPAATAPIAAPPDFAAASAPAPAGGHNPFEETVNAAPRQLADDAEADPMAVTARQAPAMVPEPIPASGQGAPVQAAPAPQAAPDSPQATAGAQAGADARAAFRAFLEGAGVSGAQIDDSNPEAALRAAGEVFRAMTTGLREVLISRAAIKSEMRIEQTMIAAQGNNALKFSVTAEDAVAAMLTPKRRGYMAPLAAAQEALSDIKDHEIAVMAGVQTALMTLLRRFDPGELEKRLSLGGLSAVLPGARKSRYWDSFRQIYGDITREAEDDFQSVFGRPFAKAYTEQSRKE